MMLLPAWLLAIAGLVVLVIAALGIAKLPDALARQHAGTKAATLSISLFAIGLLWMAYFSGWGDGWAIRLALLLLILFITLPLAAHALARSAIIEKNE